MDNISNKKPVPDNVLQNARHLMNICSQEFSHPPDALFAGVLVIASIARGVGMPLDTLLAGVEAAYADIDPDNFDVMPEVKHDA